MKALKITFCTLLAISALLLIYMCFSSVMTPINFDEERDVREKAIIEKLVLIRNLEDEFKIQNGKYTADWDSLLLFANTAQKQEFVKEGELNEAQLKAGLTEQKATDIVKRGDAKEIEENGLQNFKRDTIFTPMAQYLHIDKETISQLPYVPYAAGKAEGDGETKFEIASTEAYEADGKVMPPSFEVKTPFNVYLKDMDRQLLINLNDEKEKLERYPGLVVTNTGGNWEKL